MSSPVQLTIPDFGGLLGQGDWDLGLKIIVASFITFPNFRLMMKDEDKLCFLVCWEDEIAGVMKNFHLYYYPQEKSVEMFDLKTKKTFLKKTENENIKKGCKTLKKSF